VRDASQAAPATVTQYQARHILAVVDDTHTEAQAKAKIDTLRARIAGGATFADVARESEDLNTRDKGGDLGWFAQDAFGADFGAQLAALNDAQVSAPFKTPAGWHIVERVGTRQTDANNDNRMSQVRETIGRRKLEDEYNRFLREMRGDAYVDVRTGATATPATPSPPATPPAPATGG